jgi:hypothetical protein|tara:strand:+ start:210 stop:461 length:252 start_codon:yes stop_codon:yes gene_type:complete
MVWQDIVISIVSILLAYAIMPQIYQGFKHKKGLINTQTSLITSLGMYVISIVYFTLNLYFSSIILFISGTLWATLFFQKIIYK